MMKKNRKRIWKHRVKIGSFLAPSFLGVSVFYLVPFLVVVFYSMVDNPVSANFVFLKNFIDIIGNKAFQLAAWNTFKFSFVAVPLAVVISLLMALLLDKKIPFADKFRTAYLSPMMVPIASVILIWQVLFHYNGLVNEWLIKLGGSRIDWLKSEYAPVVVVVLFIWKNLGYNMILFMAALANIPREVTEVAELESATKWQIFWHLKLRYLSSSILFVTILSLINSLIILFFAFLTIELLAITTMIQF